MNTKERAFVAIPSPAPSIPARFRLYHGGSAKRGYLVTHDAEHGAYLGDYVYFSSLRSYADEYVERRKRGDASLFVLDARYVPDGTRVMLDDRKSWPRRPVEGALFDLIDLNRELWGLLRLLEKGGGRTLLDPHLGAEAVESLRIDLRGTRILRRSSGPDGPSAVPPRERRVLQEARIRIAGKAVAEAEPLVLATPEDEWARDRWNDGFVYLISRHGTLDVTADQVRDARESLRGEWLAEFTVPLSHANLTSMRELGLRHTGGRRWGGAGSGMIVVVPGPIPVLPRRRTAGRRPKSPRRAE